MSHDLGNGVTLTVVGCIAMLAIGYDGSVTTAYKQIATLPELARPARTLFAVGYVASNGVLGQVYIGSNGQVQVRGTSAGSVLNATVSWAF